MPRTWPVPLETTLLVRDTCLCLHAQRAARALARRFDEALRPIGLTNGQFSLLNALNRPEPVSMGPVASLLAVDRTTLTAALKPLSRRDLIQIRPAKDDSRRRLLHLTANGRRLLAEAMPIWKKTHEAMEQGLSDADELRSALQALSAAEASS